MPIKGKNKWAKGARSPEAPTDPWEGTTGIALFSICHRILSSVFSDIPEKPLARECTLRISMSLAVSRGMGSPTPTLWLFRILV
jgi:hypothetical protein